MPFSVSDRIGRFEILGALGAGGMGEVYRARDSQLGREVAIKVLPDAFSHDADRRRRFEQEARTAGGLNHPNIVAVYDVGIERESSYIVTEILEGETLDQRIQGRPLPVRKAIDYALQIANGMAAAHERGVVHRDIKPANVFVTNDGRIKILDFGLAKSIGQESPETVTVTVDDSRARRHRHRAVHVAGAGAGRSARSPHRHLQFRRGALRDVDWRAAVQAGHATRHAPRDPVRRSASVAACRSGDARARTHHPAVS